LEIKDGVITQIIQLPLANLHFNYDSQMKIPLLSKFQEGLNVFHQQLNVNMLEQQVYVENKEQVCLPHILQNK
jgi:hypothetical protein